MGTKMAEHLLKLKKDGKTVGYLKFAKYSDNDLHIQLSPNCSDWYDDPDLIDYNSIHPFVIKDKNDKDIFEGDKAFGRVWTEDLPVHRIAGEIIYYNCGYCIQTPTTYYHLNDLKDIELIEDKEDD